MNTIPELRQLEKTRKKLEVSVLTHIETITNSTPPPSSHTLPPKPEKDQISNEHRLNTETQPKSLIFAIF